MVSAETESFWAIVLFASPDTIKNNTCFSRSVRSDKSFLLLTDRFFNSFQFQPFFTFPVLIVVLTPDRDSSSERTTKLPRVLRIYK